MYNKKKYPNKEFRKLVEYSNEARKNKRIKFYDNKDPREVNRKEIPTACCGWVKPINSFFILSLCTNYIMLAIKFIL